MPAAGELPLNPRPHAVTAPSLEQTVDVETPELVVLTYSVAGIGSRAMAAMTDLLIVVAAFLLVGIAALALRLTRGFVCVGVSSTWGTALLVLAQFALLWGYYVLFEGLMDGQTPGKRFHRIRVVREGGYSVTFGVSAVRNLIRVIDMQPLFFYLVGMGSVLLTKRGRRLGDLVAGTLVVREAVRRAAPATAARRAAFAAKLTLAQKKGLRALGENGVRDFVAEYRALSADLARLRTAAGGRAVDELFYLGRLVAGAHNLLYRDRGMPLRAAVRYLFTEGPREVSRSAAPIALAALLLFLPATIAGVAVARHPTLAPKLMPRAMIQRAEDGVRRARSGEGYIDDPQLFRPVMASGIIANNVQVTFATFAGGVTAGLLSVFLLVVNGVSMGSVVGLYASKGIARLLVAFVAPHGVLELFAICVAGGAAFIVAAGILLPGPRSRRRALVENGRRAIRLIGVSTLLLLVAGTLEGFISPIEWWPIEGKLAVSGTTLVLLVAYLRGGRTQKLGS